MASRRIVVYDQRGTRSRVFEGHALIATATGSAAFVEQAAALYRSEDFERARLIFAGITGEHAANDNAGRGGR